MDLGRQRIGRSVTVMSALVESAVLSWIGTLSSAVAWSNNGPQDLEVSVM
jgi:hypothetical protein